ncbi:hypothetical protein HID58_029765 [Brassica napus]|uniref:Uncharacterized protein n=1 Tax=Brassica napus TaxID=3708 RepID=A0ABQ8CE14_BRANA|nr:hypothetical protein HID58_029765 [Brassica napus]
MSLFLVSETSVGLKTEEEAKFHGTKTMCTKKKMKIMEKNIYEEDSVKTVNSLVPKKQNKRENKGRDYEKITRFLMILLMLHKSVGGNIIDQTFTRKFIGLFARRLGNSLSVSGLCLSEIMLSTHTCLKRLTICVCVLKQVGQSSNPRTLCLFAYENKDSK